MTKLKAHATIQKILSTLALAFVLVGSFFMGFLGVGYRALEQVYGQTLPVFGGIIKEVTECQCSGGYVVVISPPRSATVYIQLGQSKEFSHYQYAQENVWTLGNFTRGSGSCRVTWCAPLAAQGTVVLQGTSLLP